MTKELDKFDIDTFTDNVWVFRLDEKSTLVGIISDLEDFEDPEVLVYRPQELKFYVGTDDDGSIYEIPYLAPFLFGGVNELHTFLTERFVTFSMADSDMEERYFDVLGGEDEEEEDKLEAIRKDGAEYGFITEDEVREEAKFRAFLGHLVTSTLQKKS